nr:flavodoxin [uncultured Ruminococcus sp.]
MSKVLVAYFSASGVTSKLAERLASAIGADLHEIKPEKPYTSADLDWRDSNSRSSVEMKDKSFRPTIANSVENMDQYDTVFVAFPIWWYVAPTIINTFLEAYNLDGKKIIPLATSGSSGMGNTNKELAPSCKGATLKEGKRFAANAGEKELADWAKKFIG